MEDHPIIESEKLDSLYTEYLGALKDVILKIENEEDIDLCKQWLEVFNQSPSEQKVGRNCLIALLYQQLKSNEFLSEPFTNLSNIRRSFSDVLKYIGIEYETSPSRAFDSTSNVHNDEENKILPSTAELTNMSSQSENSIDLKSTPHFKQIDDLNKFIQNMKKNNQILRNELIAVKKEKMILIMKNERKNQEVQKLLNAFKESKEYHLHDKKTINTNNLEIDKKNDIQQLYPEVVPDNLSNPKTNRNFEISSTDLQINDDQIFTALNALIENLKTLSLEQNPLDKIANYNFTTFSKMFEKNSNQLFQTRILIYENSIHSFILQISQSIKNYYTSQIKLSNESMKNDLRRSTSKTSQTKGVTYKISKNSFECGRNSSDKLKVIYLRKCILKMQNSKEKIIKKYENRLKEHQLQNKLQQKITRLKFASIASKIFLQSNYKNQEELFQIANHLELKYKDIVTDAINKLQSDF